jgi:hypothetical protein
MCVYVYVYAFLVHTYIFTSIYVYIYTHKTYLQQGPIRSHIRISSRWSVSWEVNGPWQVVLWGASRWPACVHVGVSECVALSLNYCRQHAWPMARSPCEEPPGDLRICMWAWGNVTIFLRSVHALGFMHGTFTYIHTYTHIQVLTRQALSASCGFVGWHRDAWRVVQRLALRSP